jgi:hypothetical protein
MCPALRAALCATCVFVLCLSAEADVCPPDSPSIRHFHATGFDGKSFSFEWDPLPAAMSGPSAMALTTYEVVLYTGSSYCHFAPPLVTATTTANSFTLPLTTPDAAYAVYVRAQGDTCTKTESMLLVDSFTSPPSKPFLPGVVIDGDHMVKLEFEYRDERAFGVDVERADGDGEFHYIGALPMCAEGPKTFAQHLSDGRHQYRAAVSNAATRASGPVYSNSLSADVGATGLPDVRFAATPAAIAPGGTTVLVFEADGATSVAIDNGLGPQSARGSVVVSPAVTTAYTLTATNPVGTVSSIVTVIVVEAGGRRRSVHR